MLADLCLLQREEARQDQPQLLLIQRLTQVVRHLGRQTPFAHSLLQKREAEMRRRKPTAYFDKSSEVDQDTRKQTKHSKLSARAFCKTHAPEQFPLASNPAWKVT